MLRLRLRPSPSDGLHPVFFLQGSGIAVAQTLVEIISQEVKSPKHYKASPKKTRVWKISVVKLSMERLAFGFRAVTSLGSGVLGCTPAPVSKFESICKTTKS